MADQFDPRVEADAQISRALQIVCDACDANDQPRRDYTQEELETLFFSLGTAMVQLAKVPGGAEAKERYYTNLKNELAKRKCCEACGHKLTAHSGATGRPCAEGRCDECSKLSR